MNLKKTAAGEFINRALALNPQFDVLQATSARQILENLSGVEGGKEQKATLRV